MEMNDMREVIEEYLALYPTTFKYMTEIQKDRMARQWLTKYGAFDKSDIITAMIEYEKNSDYSNPPTTKQLLATIRKVENDRKNKNLSRRIETSEEVCANLYHEIMAKTKKTDDDWQTLERLKKYVMLFEGEGWQERYIAHFGKPREEFEKL